MERIVEPINCRSSRKLLDPLGTVVTDVADLLKNKRVRDLWGLSGESKGVPLFEWPLEMEGGVGASSFLQDGSF